ncbi:UNVERIFIED_CONTAM: hypothetical protein K2H54_051568 [Gekko kuhli]
MQHFHLRNQGQKFPICLLFSSIEFADLLRNKVLRRVLGNCSRKAIILMGKNTMMYKAIQGHLENNLALEKFLPYIHGNMSFVFIKEELAEIKDMSLGDKVLWLLPQWKKESEEPDEDMGFGLSD